MPIPQRHDNQCAADWHPHSAHPRRSSYSAIITTNRADAAAICPANSQISASNRSVATPPNPLRSCSTNTTTSRTGQPPHSTRHYEQVFVASDPFARLPRWISQRGRFWCQSREDVGRYSTNARGLARVRVSKAPRTQSYRSLRRRSRKGIPLSTRGSPGRPSTRSPRMLRITSLVPPSIELARDRRNHACTEVYSIIFVRSSS